MSKRFEQVVSASLAMAAIAIGGSVVYRTFAPPPQSIAVPKARTFKAWRALDSVGYHIGGRSDAPVSIVVFSDLQCPACRYFHRVVRQSLTKYSDRVKLTFISHPLEYHEFALPGARATQCVAASGASVSRWLDLIFEKQDSLGKKSWASFAAEAGVPDSTGIARCASGTDSSSTTALQKFDSWSERAGVGATPTILVNGVVLGKTPSRAELDTIILSHARERP